jgi:hypothetical protein
MDINPLLALSLARTMLDDPAALPESEESRVQAIGSLCFMEPPVDSVRVAYAIERIDAALAVLRLDPVEDVGLEAYETVSALRALVVAVADELDAAGGTTLAASHLRSAVACLTDALTAVRG